MERNRNIHTYVGAGSPVDRLRHAIEFLREHAHSSCRAMRRSTAMISRRPRRRGSKSCDGWSSIWTPAPDDRSVTHRDSPQNHHGVPEPLAHLEAAVSVIVSLKHDGRAVHLSLLKDHDNPTVSDTPVALDPTTMLLIKE